MTTINIIRRDGEAATIDAKSGQTVIQALREHDIDDLLALCGGSCACATCHVYVDQAQIDRLQPMSETEDALLDKSEHRRDNSRLGCQILISDVLEGITITIAPDE